MKQVNNTKIINYFSLILIILEYIYTFIKGNNVNINGLLFIWVIIINILFYNLNNKYLKYSAILIMTTAPIFTVRSVSGYTTLFIISIASFIYYYLEFYKVNYDTYMNEFKRGFIIIIGISVFSILGSNFIHNMNQTTPYIIIYLVSGISILRIIRFEDYEHDSRTLGKMNLYYNYVTLGVAFFLSIKAIRTIIYDILADIMYVIWHIISYMLAFILSGVFIVFWFIGNILSKFINKDKLDKWVNKIYPAVGKPKNDKHINPIVRSHHFLNENLQLIIVWAIIIISIIFLIISIYKKASLIERKQKDYEDEKDFIHEAGNDRKNLVKRISEYIKHKNNTEIIRLYYKKFLKLCMENDITIKTSDTSSDVNRRVQSKLKADEHILETFRGIYVKIRYGGHEADKNDLEQFRNIYNKEAKKFKE